MSKFIRHLPTLLQDPCYSSGNTVPNGTGHPCKCDNTLNTNELACLDSLLSSFRFAPPLYGIWQYIQDNDEVTLPIYLRFYQFVRLSIYTCIQVLRHNTVKQRLKYMHTRIYIYIYTYIYMCVCVYLYMCVCVCQAEKYTTRKQLFRIPGTHRYQSPPGIIVICLKRVDRSSLLCNINSNKHSQVILPKKLNLSLIDFNIDNCWNILNFVAIWCYYESWVELW